MSDALSLIAEAQDRQRRAEQDCEYWKGRATRERQRMKVIFQMVRRTPIKPPELTADGDPNWQQIERIVEQFAEIVGDPYAVMNDEDDLSMTHETAKLMMAYHLNDIIKAAVAASRKETGG